MVAVRLPFAFLSFSGTSGVWAFGPRSSCACAGNATCISPVSKALTAFPSRCRPAFAGRGADRSM